MKFLAMLPRLLLGLMFLVFGLNGFFHFLPMPTPAGDAGDFFGVLFRTHYYVVIFACQVIGGALLLAGCFVPLGLVFLGPILVNILTFHATMAPEGFAPGLVATVLWFIVFYQRRAAFAPLFRA